jgi:pre-mRNA splicing factor component
LGDGKPDIEEDAADVQARILKQQQIEADKLNNARSSVIKRQDELPRPPANGLKQYLQYAKTEPDASAMQIFKEMQGLIQHDAGEYPVVKTDSGVNRGKKRKKRNLQSIQNSMPPPDTPIDILPEEEMHAARDMILTELNDLLESRICLVLQERKASNRDEARTFLLNENIRVSLDGASKMVFLPERGWIDTPSDQDRIDSMRYELQVLQEATAALKKKNDKVAAKLAVTNGGYSKRAEKFQAEIAQHASDLEQAKRDEILYQALHKNEIEGGNHRLEQWNQQIKALRVVEAALQKEYGSLLVEKRRLRVAGAARSEEQQS